MRIVSEYVNISESESIVVPRAAFLSVSVPLFFFTALYFTTLQMSHTFADIFGSQNSETDFRLNGRATGGSFVP